MGNKCETLCCQGTDLKIGVLSSQNFDKLIHSKLVENQFPEELISATVKEKMKLLQIEIDLANSEIWKYEDFQIKRQDPYNVVYAIINKATIKNKHQIEPEENIIIHKNVPSDQNKVQDTEKKEEAPQKKDSINPDRFENATIFLFMSSEIRLIRDQGDQSQNPPIRTLMLKKVYHGPINSSMKASNAIIILENGDYYKGNSNEFNFQGKGLIKNSLGNHTYEGEWLNNKPHGMGVEQLEDKFKYEGDFINGKWQGKGKLTLFQSKDKFVIEGTFLQGNIEGPVKIFNASSQLVYDGMFRSGKQHGMGKWYGPYGQSYVGEFVQGKKQGFGKYIFKSGKQYQGLFKDDKPDGDGQLIEGNKRTKGYWYQGMNIITKNVVEE